MSNFFETLMSQVEGMDPDSINAVANLAKVGLDTQKFNQENEKAKVAIKFFISRIYRSKGKSKEFIVSIGHEASGLEALSDNKPTSGFTFDLYLPNKEAISRVLTWRNDVLDSKGEVRIKKGFCSYTDKLDALIVPLEQGGAIDMATEGLFIEVPNESFQAIETIETVANIKNSTAKNLMLKQQEQGYKYLKSDLFTRKKGNNYVAKTVGGRPVFLTTRLVKDTEAKDVRVEGNGWMSLADAKEYIEGELFSLNVTEGPTKENEKDPANLDQAVKNADAENTDKEEKLEGIDEQKS